MRKWSRAVLAMTLIAPLVGGCAEQKTTSSISKEEVNEPVTLDWYVNYSWFTTIWGDSAVAKAITQKTGMEINFVVPSGNEEEKLSSLMASDTLPDLITLSWEDANAQKLVSEDQVYALNELADQYDTAFFDVVDEDSYHWYQSEDGNVYAYPNSSFSPKDYETHDNIYSNQNFMVRKDIYEAIGSPDMTTPEGFAAAVKKAVEMFPEVDGKPLIPIGSTEFKTEGCTSFDRYLQNFLAIPYEKDGQYYERNLDPEYIRWLKAFRQMGEDGYLDNEIFIDKRTQTEENIANGRYFCMIYQSADMQEQENELYETHPEQIYIPVDGPKNSSGDDPQLPGAGLNGWTITMISKNCKDPQKAIEMLTYLISEEGQKMIYLGVEGVTYDVIDGQCVTKPEVEALLNSNRTEYNRLYGADNTYWMLQDNVMQLQWEADSRNQIGGFRKWTRPYTVYVGQYDVSFPSGSDEAVRYRKMEEEWGNTLPKLLLAPTEEEFDEVLQAYEARRQELGSDKIQQAATVQMNALKEKLEMQ